MPADPPVSSASTPAWFRFRRYFRRLVNGGNRQIFENDFSLNEKGIPINGLVWMGDEAFMKEQIDSKPDAGFTCIKMKIGAIDFETECKLMRYIGKNYSKEKLTLRVDANGAFRTEDCMLRLKALEELEKAFEDSDGGIDWMKVHPVFKPLRSDERFEALVRKLRYPAAREIGEVRTKRDNQETLLE